MFVYLYICVFVYVCICIFVCIFVYVCVCIFGKEFPAEGSRSGSLQLSLTQVVIGHATGQTLHSKTMIQFLLLASQSDAHTEIPYPIPIPLIALKQERPMM